tara:strand:+ start:144 stop:317 length:174 start_codon:yes stop_codon:yes gene_type:complete
MRNYEENIESVINSDDDGLSTYDLTLIASSMYSGLYAVKEEENVKSHNNEDGDLLAA